MGDEEAATLEGQFFEFARLMDTKRSGETMTLYRSDYWMRQAKIIDDRKITMTDTGLLWWKLEKTELNWDEWYQFLNELIQLKGLDQEYVECSMTNCGLPGQTEVIVPQYKEFFKTYTPKEKLPF